MPAVSVIIPTHDRARLLGRAVASVRDQTWKDLEIIVVDDASTDDTARVVEGFGSPVRYLSHRENRGVSAARNTGILASRAPFIAFLDSDDYWLPARLSVQMEWFSRTPGAVACQTEEIWIRRGRRVNPRTRHLKPSGDIFEQSLRLCLVSPSAVLLARSLLDTVGLFDESLPACEDYDLWLRIACRHPIHCIREPLVVREGGRADQLSARFSGMDRFRIHAIENVLASGMLTVAQAAAALKELRRKCTIYGNGCLKRGRTEEGERYLGLAERWEERNA